MQCGAERERWGCAGPRRVEREIGLCWASSSRERDGARNFFHGFPPKNMRKIISTHFPQFSMRFSFILFFLLFFSTPNKGKKLTFSIFFFPPNFLRTKHTLRVSENNRTQCINSFSDFLSRRKDNSLIKTHDIIKLKTKKILYTSHKCNDTS